MTILVVDDHPEILLGIEARVRRVFPDADYHFVSKSRDALFIARSNFIDLLISDLEFKDDKENDGWKILAKILTHSPNTKAIAYTSHGSYNIMKESIESGFHSFLEKGCSLLEFEQTLRGVLENGSFESPSIIRLKKKRYSIVEKKFEISLENLMELSDREIETSILFSQTSNKELIAKSLSESGGTVKTITVETYLKRIMRKLSIHNRTDLSLFCIEFKDSLEKIRTSNSQV